MGRLAAHAPLRLAIFALLALALVWPALGDAASANEFRDSQVMLLHERAAVDTVRRYGELPLWNPWYCGGMYGLGAAQARFAAPPFLLSLWLGAERAEILIVFLFALLGMEGTYRWLSLRVRSPLAAAAVAPVFALSGQFAVAFFRGWTNFWGFELVPWVLFGVTLAARRRLAGVAIAALAFAGVLGFGGTFAAPLVAVAVLAEALRALSETGPRARARSLAMLALTASFMAAVCLFRLLPVAETLEAAPRIMAGTPGHPPRALAAMLAGGLVVKDGDVELAGQFYAGGAFLALAALGGADRQRIRAMLLAFFFVWLAAGYARKPALFALLRELPVLSALRYPERFLWVAILFACEPAANAIERMPRLGEGSGWRTGALAVLGGAVAFTLLTQIMAFHRVAAERTLGSLQEAPAGTPFRQGRGNRWLAVHFQAMNLGSLSCWEVHPVVQSPRLRGDLAAEEYLDDPAAGEVARTGWSPNRVGLHVSLTRPAKLLVNQNWHPGWRSSAGEVVSEEGLLAVRLPEGERDVTLTFAPRSARVGAITSAVALAALGVLAFLSRRGRPLFAGRRWPLTLAVAALPWIAFGVARASYPEPPFPPSPPRNADGTPALVEVAPDTATPVGARFAVPVVVEATRVTPPDAHGNVYMRLYLRRTGPLPRTTAVFVHLERRGKSPPDPTKDKKKSKDEPQDFYNADHQVVARSFFLSDAPEGVLVDDAFAQHLDKPMPGDWDVFVALGHVSGRRGRAKVVEPGRAVVDEDRIRIGSFRIGP